jgi:4-hydroxybenzoate polyprenyltransferase
MLYQLLKTMRPRQWPKNGFVLAAVVFDRQLSLTNLDPLLRALAAFSLFCLLSSTVYIINDLVDIQADRQHPVKRMRPLASGKLSMSAAIAAAVAFLVFTFPAAYLLSPKFMGVCLAYFLLILAYTFWLKHLPIIDVLVIATGFVLRVAGGVLALQHIERFSPWLYVVTSLFALYLGFGKRRAELALLAGNSNAHRKVLEGYTMPLLDQIITIVSSTTIIAYSLYTFSAPNLPAEHTMMLTIPFVLYGILRYLYVIQVKHAGGAPEEVLLTDRPLQVTIVLYALAVIAVLYLQ